MLFKNKLIKIAAAAAIALSAVGLTTAIDSTTAHASTFHYFNKSHKAKILGVFDNFTTITIDKHGKLANPDDVYNDNTTNEELFKSKGWKYINGKKYYLDNDTNLTDDYTTWLPAYARSKKYNDLSYMSVYVITGGHNKTNDGTAWNDGKTHFDDRFWLGKSDVITVDNYTKNSKYVYVQTPPMDTHSACGTLVGGGEPVEVYMKHSDFVKHAKKAAPNVRWREGSNRLSYSNKSLSTGHVWYDGHYTRYYTK